MSQNTTGTIDPQSLNRNVGIKKWVTTALLPLGVSLFLANGPVQAEETFSDKIFSQLINEKDFGKAYSYLGRFEKSNNANVFLNKGFMIFSGYIKTQPMCDAVFAFEKARNLGSTWALTYLTYIYNGAYSAVAAEEGQPDALLDLANNYWGSYKIGNAMTPFSKERALLKVFRYYKLAEIQGAAGARSQANLLSDKLKQLGVEAPKVEKNFKKVICDVRQGVK